MIEPYPFQAAASDQIAQRVAEFIVDPLMVGRNQNRRPVPFLQLLSSITASGKTIILADACSSIAKRIPIPPVVLWLSKATVVVEQTYASLDAGGDLHTLIEGFSVRTLEDFDHEELADIADPFLFFATVGTFNQKDKEKGTRRVFRSAIDDANESTWELLKQRLTSDGYRRPLVVVYDEAHNLSNQQTELLLELEPDAFLLSTATQKLPSKFDEDVVSILRTAGQYTDDEMITVVDAHDVSSSGLIKNAIELIGRRAPMTDVIDDLCEALKEAEEDAKSSGLRGLPKAVYVCKTNVVEGSDEKETHKKPFNQRTVPPILIWRHLTEVLGVPADEIAVYCDLKMDKNYPAPDDFVLFSGGDHDYASFVKGDFRHVIFNQALQEGWDDPLAYFAYIDKSMGSRVQAEQIVGRLLRQPGRKHYASDRLNTSAVYVRVESVGVFDEVVAAIEEKIRTGDVDVKLAKSPPGEKGRQMYQPKSKMTVPHAAIVTDAAERAIQQCIQTMNDYRNDDGSNILGVGHTARVEKLVGEPGNQQFEWEEIGHSAQVLARWLFSREVRRIYPGALGLAVTSGNDGSSSKFDAKIGLGSNAAIHIAEVAKKVAEAFVENAQLKLRRPNPYVVGPVRQRPEDLVKFDNALHDGYSGMNTLEKRFAPALDRRKIPWCRNPPRVGYGIPMIEPGTTDNFYPDFLAWSDGDVYAIDTKAPHLHADAARKMVQIRPAGEGSPRVFVRFVSEGLVDVEGARRDRTGFTVWTFRPNGDFGLDHVESVDEALAQSLVADLI